MTPSLSQLLTLLPTSRTPSRWSTSRFKAGAFAPMPAPQARSPSAPRSGTRSSRSHGSYVASRQVPRLRAVVEGTPRRFSSWAISRMTSSSAPCARAIARRVGARGVGGAVRIGGADREALGPARGTHRRGVALRELVPVAEGAGAEVEVVAAVHDLGAGRVEGAVVLFARAASGRTRERRHEETVRHGANGPSTARRALPAVGTTPAPRLTGPASGVRPRRSSSKASQTASVAGRPAPPGRRRGRTSHPASRSRGRGDQKNPQLPLRHARGKAQPRPQPPQLDALVRVSASQPLVATLSQSA